MKLLLIAAIVSAWCLRFGSDVCILSLLAGWLCRSIWRGGA